MPEPRHPENSDATTRGECSHDEECAAWARRIGGVQRSEPELRQQAKLLVEQHWGEIAVMAHELTSRTLDDTEVEIIADQELALPMSRRKKSRVSRPPRDPAMTNAD